MGTSHATCASSVLTTCVRKKCTICQYHDIVHWTGDVDLQDSELDNLMLVLGKEEIENLAIDGVQTKYGGPSRENNNCDVIHRSNRGPRSQEA